MKKSKILLAVLALVMVLTVSIGSALAYFTDWDTANGSAKWSKSSEMIEDLDGDTKTVTIENTGDLPIWVRVRGFAGADPNATKFEVSYDHDSNWDGEYPEWCYYKIPLEAGESCTMKVIIDAEYDQEVAHEFHVSVVYEATPVAYDADGNALEADWSYILPAS